MLVTSNRESAEYPATYLPSLKRENIMAAVRGRKKVEPEVEAPEELEEDLEEELEEDGDVEEAADDLDELELDEVEEDDEEDEVDEAPAAKSTKRPAKKAAAKKPAAPKKDAIEFGTAQLLDHIEAETGKRYDGRALRVLLRKMTADGQLVREHGQRYEFTGPEDAKVQKIIERIKGGEIEAAAKAALDKLKADAEVKRAAKKAAKEAEEAAGEDESDEEVETKPAPRRRTPAKKAATTTRRAPARKKATDVAEDDEDGDDE